MTREFGELLKKIRLEHAMTQSQLVMELREVGNQIGEKSKGTISKWESGKPTPDPETVKDLEEIFSLPKGTLLGPADYIIDVTGPLTSPITLAAQQRQAHCEELAGIARAILKGDSNLVDAEEYNDKRNPNWEYLVRDAGGSGEPVSREELASRLEYDVWLAKVRYSERQLGYLVSHLESESRAIKSEGFHSVLKNDPYGLIQTLAKAGFGKALGGKCDMCRHL